MTLASVIVPLLALCVAARGITFLPALGCMTAIAMLIDNVAPFQEAGAAAAVFLAVLPVLFLNFYQHDLVRESKTRATPFLAPGVMILLTLMNLYSDSQFFPAGACVVMAGLVTASCRQTMVWQWAGLLTCAEGVLLSAVTQQKVVISGVVILAGFLIVLMGCLYVSRVMPRVKIVRAPARQDKKSRRWKRPNQPASDDVLDSAGGAPPPDYVPQRPGVQERGSSSS